MTSIYLDHNATAPILPEVAQALAECDQAGYANPASQHQAGRRARRVLEDARETIGQVLGAKLSGPRTDQVVFTSGGTEANNLALLGLAAARRHPGRIIVSAIEHPSVLAPAEHLAAQGWEVAQAPVSVQGVVDVQRLAELLDERTAVVAVMLGNNETGVLQPVVEIAQLCRARNIPMHADAVQVAGKLPVDFQALGVSTLSISGHKCHGPRGIGVLLVRHGVSLAPTLYGGMQQQGLRPGTESIAPAVGLCRALMLWQQEAAQRAQRLAQFRDEFESLITAGDPGVVVNGAEAPRLPHTSNLAFVGLDRQALFMALDMAGVACSTGSACASGSSEPSPVLLAMGCPEEVVEGSLRFSLGATTTLLDVQQAASRILKICSDLRNQKPLGKATGASRQTTAKLL